MIQQVTSGNNNYTYNIVTPIQRYVLRIYPQGANLDWICHEHALLIRLGQQGLSFSIPTPIPDHSGATLLAISDQGVQVLAALFYHISGLPPNGDTLAQSRCCGSALAELDQMLSSLTLSLPLVPRRPCGDLARIHPSVPDPLKALDWVPLDSGRRAHVYRIISDVEATLPMLYRSLPQQLVHRDFDASNVLMSGNTVTGVLDFEFAGPDLRAFDLARSLSLFTISPWSIPDGWERVTAFICGYREHLTLTSGEIEAIPCLMRLYRIWSLIHREGQRQRGLANESDVLARALGLLRQEAWLDARHQELVGLLC